MILKCPSCGTNIPAPDRWDVGVQIITCHKCDTPYRVAIVKLPKGSKS